MRVVPTIDLQERDLYSEEEDGVEGQSFCEEVQAVLLLGWRVENKCRREDTSDREP